MVKTQSFYNIRNLGTVYKMTVLNTEIVMLTNIAHRNIKTH